MLRNVSGKDIDDVVIILCLKAGGTREEGVPLDGRRGAKDQAPA